MNKNLFKVIAIATMVAPAGLAYAATESTTFTVDAEVVASCELTAVALDFGAINPLINETTPTDMSTTIDITCSNGATYDVGLNAGAAVGATVTARQMTGAGGLLNYALYLDSGHVSNWGETIGTDTQADTGTGAVQTHTVYGQIPAGQQAAPIGTYTDTITVTVTY